MNECNSSAWREELQQLKKELSDKMDAIDERLKEHVSETAPRLTAVEALTDNLESRRIQTDLIVYGDPLNDNPGLVGLNRDMRRLFKLLAAIGGPVTLYMIYDFLNRVLSNL